MIHHTICTVILICIEFMYKYDVRLPTNMIAHCVGHLALCRSIRFGSGLFKQSSVRRFGSVRFGSVRFEQIILPLRRGSACAFRTRRGSVRFGSVRFRVRFRPVQELNGSVRFGSAGSVRFLLPSCYTTPPRHHHPQVIARNCWLFG